MSNPSLQNILYVEDEPDIQAVAGIALESIGGFTLKTCSNGHDAIDAAIDFQPDLILLDVMMPDMDGPTTLAELRKLPQLNDTPAMFMTAKVQPQEIDYLKSLGAIDVIPKPFDPMTLSEQIKEIWLNYKTGS